MHKFLCLIDPKFEWEFCTYNDLGDDFWLAEGFEEESEGAADGED